jgi:hypothetical protein
MKYIVEFNGKFGFIKPWSSVRDSKTKSNFFLTPSILMGIERKLFPDLLINQNGKLNKIIRYRLSFDSVSFQQESTNSINFERLNSKFKKIKFFRRNPSIVSRGILINPKLYLMFDSEEDANEAITQHICLCRNEDVMLPSTRMIAIENESEFESDDFSGYESFECKKNDNNSIYCGLNKYTSGKQYIQYKVFGTPSNLI